jgi:preprotein translocase subunit SecE
LGVRVPPALPTRESEARRRPAVGGELKHGRDRIPAGNGNLGNMSSWNIFWIVAIGGTVFYLWKTGQLLRLSAYVMETREELRKCNWPTWNELKGSTVVVIISMALLGGFTMGVDAIFALVIHGIA